MKRLMTDNLVYFECRCGTKLAFLWAFNPTDACDRFHREFYPGLSGDDATSVQAVY